MNYPCKHGVINYCGICENDSLMTNSTTPLQNAVERLEQWPYQSEAFVIDLRLVTDAAKQRSALQTENEGLRDLNRITHELMVSGEKRGVAKGRQDRDSLKSTLESMTKERDEFKQRLLELSDSPQGELIVERQKLQGCERQLKETEQLLESTRAENVKIQKTLCFFASVIKSGESWSETCEKEFNTALSTTLPTNSDNSKDVK